MSKYFRHIPKVDYDLGKDGDTANVVDVTKRFHVHALLNDRTTIYYNYEVKDGEKPETIAYKMYNDVGLGWIVLMVNEVLDPFFDWPLGYREFQLFIIGKYGSIATSQSGIHHYEQILRAGAYNTRGEWTKEQKVIVDSTTYDTLAAASRQTVTNYTYEEDRNDNLRKIRVLDPQYINDIQREVRTIFD